jgi:hypothetical protein
MKRLPLEVVDTRFYSLYPSAILFLVPFIELALLCFVELNGSTKFFCYVDKICLK